MTDLPRLDDFPHRATDKLRYGDTDRQGHVNNAVFSTFMETGRVELMLMHLEGMPPEGCELVIANLTLDFRGEIRWPGEVQIGTRVARVGRSSITMDQAIFQGELCAATAQTTLVMIDAETRRSAPFGEELTARLDALR